MKRFYYPFLLLERRKVFLEGAEFHHLKVVRVKEGEKVTLFDGKEREAEARVKKITPLRAELEIEKIIKVLPPRVWVSLYQALPKPKKMDFIVQKATELGVAKIVPFYSERSIPKLEKDKEEKKLLHWQRIATEASKQCRRGFIPLVERVGSFPEVMGKRKEKLCLFFWEGEKKRELKKIFEKYRGEKKLAVFVGPEGGFSSQEAELARERGSLFLSLGERILRSETAALSILSIIMYEWGELE